MSQRTDANGRDTTLKSATIAFRIQDLATRCRYVLDNNRQQKRNTYEVLVDPHWEPTLAHLFHYDRQLMTLSGSIHRLQELFEQYDFDEIVEKAEDVYNRRDMPARERLEQIKSLLDAHSDLYVKPINDIVAIPGDADQEKLLFAKDMHNFCREFFILTNQHTVVVELNESLVDVGRGLEPAL